MQNFIKTLCSDRRVFPLQQTAEKKDEQVDIKKHIVFSRNFANALKILHIGLPNKIVTTLRRFESRWQHECNSLGFVVSCAGNGLYNVLITSSEESYRMRVSVCDLANSNLRRSKPHLRCGTTEKKKFFWQYNLLLKNNLLILFLPNIRLLYSYIRIL